MFTHHPRVPAIETLFVKKQTDPQWYLTLILAIAITTTANIFFLASPHTACVSCAKIKFYLKTLNYFSKLRIILVKVKTNFVNEKIVW